MAIGTLNSEELLRYFVLIISSCLPPYAPVCLRNKTTSVVSAHSQCGDGCLHIALQRIYMYFQKAVICP